MNRNTTLLLRPVSMMSLLLLLLSVNVVRVDSFVGINWGRMATQRLVPSMVVDLLLQNGIPELKIFSPSPNVLQAFANCSIGISVMFQENNLVSMNNSKDIYDWVEEYIKLPVDNGVNIRSIYVGNEPFSRKYKKRTFDRSTYFLGEVAGALEYHNLKHIKATTAHFTDVLTDATKPSECDFRDDIRVLMIDLLKFLNQTNAPFVINFFPIYVVTSRQMPVEFAFFDDKAGLSIQDGPHVYNNIFTFIYDSLVVALTKAGFPNMEIVVGQIGWPTDGYPNANPHNAERYHRGLLQYLKRNEGTPLRPNRKIDVFLTALSDENRIMTQWGEYQRHWGIYRHDGSPKYKIDFSMQDRNIEPTTAKGTVKMPNRWCTYNGKFSDKPEIVMQNVKFACNKSDCTSLSPGATCDKLDFNLYVSFAYNAYFQMYNQKKESCDFNGTGMITPDDPSTLKCRFPVEILESETSGDIVVRPNSGVRFMVVSKLTIGVPLGLAFLALIFEFSTFL